MNPTTDKQKYFIIDFDSTFTKVEAMDELCQIALQNHPEKNERLSQIQSLTDQAMDGTLSFRESLHQRIAILEANKSHLPELIEKLGEKVSESFKRNQTFFDTYKDTILIVSSGFKDFIVPIVTKFGIKTENIYANEFEFDEDGKIKSFDASNVLSEDNGKVKLLRNLNLQGDIYVIGDGYTDYEIKEAGLANEFYAFTENIKRDKVVDKADREAQNLDEFLYVNKLARNISYPKNRIKVLLLENIHQSAKEAMEKEGYQVELLTSALTEDELIEKIKDISILGIRSKTNLTSKVVEHADRLLAVGAFCIGTNQIDLEACQDRGIVVFNAPYSNTRSVVELAIGEMIMLMRGVPKSVMEMHTGKWNKSATNSFEVRGKKLGIIGYGNIGAQLSVVAEALGMKVYFYDIVDRLALGNATMCDSLEELLSISDVISLHVDGRTENTNIIRKEHFDLMKEGVVFMNLARGQVVDIAALVENLKSGKILGAGVDVYPEEPKNNQEEFISELRQIPNVILTPHVGGSTVEAQENIAQFVPHKMIDYINAGNTFSSVNFPELQLPKLQNAHRLMHIHKNVPGILAKINQIFAKNEVNIVGQYLKTNEKIGYVITDINQKYHQEVIEELKNIEDTIRFRILY
ncbi:haloacid dehalogenase superfamily protein, subfamily IB, phosphoserine phosphatase [Bernardetia litoralis DSM 6794]|uniref:D-3-phosphoglycerate dehydrogenase n=1 Tax=Bernardetia litoralis (strain ATCC 23117 / DSM 6794 / NBRC 15988 / NCIMB 1366 / Fx l1 / Sio-4) TaxID=880071 RepID=I4AIQ1_BERLS|nr:phosphoglycerate dehydrogenase [Bernardetia litoralis]AFM03836.1 haloacid dehalogenase superfamily protein, subfamily IB, phosphoserine phosphatase [Bernardetia litoralis DSM 6794]